MLLLRTLASFMTLSGAIALTLSGVQAQSAAATVADPSDLFVSVRGNQFFLGDRPFRVAGVNNHYLTSGSNEEVTRVLDDAVAMHANVVRTIIQPVIGSLDGSTPTIWNWKSTSDSSNLGVHGRYMLAWNSRTAGMVIDDGPDGLQRLDFLLVETRRRHLKLILALLDFWAYTGGAQQMNAWYGSRDEYTFFAQDPRTWQDYRTWVDHVIRRRNTMNGVTYRDDPTIFSWELMNEPDIQPRGLLLDWVHRASALIKSLDPNHLVSTGHSNLIIKLADLSIKTIDFGTWHGYAGYEKMSIPQFVDQIHEFCAIGAGMNKPVLMEEFGLAGSQPVKLEAYKSWLDALIRDRNCAGWVVWRLVSRQDDGQYPSDHDGFDIHNDGGDLWRGLQLLADETRRAAN